MFKTAALLQRAREASLSHACDVSLQRVTGYLLILNVWELGDGVEHGYLQEGRPLLLREIGSHTACGFEYHHFTVSVYGIVPSSLFWWNEDLRNLLHICCLRWTLAPLDLFPGTVEERHIDSSWLSSVMLILLLYYEDNIRQQLSITNPGKTEEEQILCHK